MHKLLLPALLALPLGFLSQTAMAQNAANPQSLIPPAYSQARVDELLIPLPLPKGEEAYGDIDGKAMHKYVVDLANIAKRYRDNGHPKFWGRLIGTSAEKETDQYLAGKLRAIGVSDVKIQPLDLTPQWFPADWHVSISGGGKTVDLTSAQPFYQANALPQGGVELEAVDVGMGRENDFAGKDVKGKAVFFYCMSDLPINGPGRISEVVKRASDLGAVVVFSVWMLPGNKIFQAYPSATRAPAFTLGNEDGVAAQNMIGAGLASGTPPKVKVSLDAGMVANLQSELVWGTLPGAGDETIYVTAHKDGWFEAAGDNAAGVAGALGIMEHFAKIPQAQRRRTIIFIGLDGHHNATSAGNNWLLKNGATLFAKTALVINDEHPATIYTQSRPRAYPIPETIAWANIPVPVQWYGGGKALPELNRITWNAFKTFGVPMDFDELPVPPSGDGSSFYRFTPVVAVSEFHTFFHTDWETPETVPWTGLEATTRAYAKVIDEVNKLPLSALQLPQTAP